jgi:hypothetical protein
VGIEPNGVADKFGWEPMALEGYVSHSETLSQTPFRGSLLM